MLLETSPWAAGGAWGSGEWTEAAHTSDGGSTWFMPHHPRVVHSPSPWVQLRVPPSPLSILCTCSSLSVYSHFQASSSPSWQLLCLHLPNNIRILPLKNQEVTNLLLARIDACHRQVPRSQASCSLLYLGGDGPFPPICSVFCFSEVLKSLRKHLARNETEVWLSNVCLWACGYPRACSTLGYRFVQVP